MLKNIISDLRKRLSRPPAPAHEQLRPEDLKRLLQEAVHPLARRLEALEAAQQQDPAAIALAEARTLNQAIVEAIPLVRAFSAELEKPKLNNNCDDIMFA